MYLPVGETRSPLGEAAARVFSRRGVVPLFAILALTVSLANRTFDGYFFSHPTVHSVSPNAKVQHRERDAAAWVAPVGVFERLRAIEPSLAQRPEERVLVDLHCESLYNRPPPVL